jgi:uncharacterized membrane protein YfcA
LQDFFLVLSAILLFVRGYINPIAKEAVAMKPLYGLILGAAIGILSGLIGVGGGIFLSPILIMTNWTDIKKASGIAALFILCNSISALLGHVTAFKQIDFAIIYWIIAVCLGGILGFLFRNDKNEQQINYSCSFFSFYFQLD